MSDGPTFGSLFSGFGGLDLGLERAGWSCQWQVENNPYAQNVLARHWPAVARYRDVRTIDPDDLEPVDAVVGGFPCQPVSQSGKQLAQHDERWLWPEFRRIIAVLRPRIVVIENVLGLRYRGLRDVLADLAGLGFDAEWSVVSACQVGAPHMRRRLFVVAHPAGLGSQRAGSDGGGAARPEQGRQAADVLEARRARWPREPDVGRVAHGVPARVERIVGLGNAVVPAVAELIGAVAGAGHVEDVPLSASEPTHDPKAGVRQ